MPAPDRVGQLQNFNNVINPTKGIVGHYSDVEIDALLAGLGGGGATVDLSAYATTAYVDGELAKVYDKAAVDAAIAAAIAGVAAPDLTPYATVEQVEALIADPANHPATDLSDYYTKPEVDQKFVDAATGGTVDLSGYATQQQLADALAALPTGSLAEHDAPLPAVGPGVTPLQVLEAWAAYEPGVHLFKDGNLVLLAKTTTTSTVNTPDGEKPTASAGLAATVFVNGTGTTLIKVTTTAIDGVQSNAPSEIVASMGGQWVKMNSTKGDVAFAPTGMGDVFGGGGVTPDFAGLATEKYVADSIAASLAALGIGDGGTGVVPSNPVGGGTREAVTEEQVRTIVAESAMTEAEVTRIARTLMTGGKEPPPDRPWSATVLANVSQGSVGLVECRLRNGQITLRGELAYTTSATGSFTNVRSLPMGFPRPDVEYSGVVIGKENGVTFRAVAYKIQTDGMVAVCPIGGKITHVTFDGATAYV